MASIELRSGTVVFHENICPGTPNAPCGMPVVKKDNTCSKCGKEKVTVWLCNLDDSKGTKCNTFLAHESEECTVSDCWGRNPRVRFAEIKVKEAAEKNEDANPTLLGETQSRYGILVSEGSCYTCPGTGGNYCGAVVDEDDHECLKCGTKRDAVWMCVVCFRSVEGVLDDCNDRTIGCWGRHPRFAMEITKEKAEKTNSAAEETVKRCRSEVGVSYIESARGNNLFLST